jgi:hypothetical protein
MKIRRHEAIEQHFQNGVGFVLLQGHQARRAKNDAAALISGGSREMLYNLVPPFFKAALLRPPFFSASATWICRRRSTSVRMEQRIDPYAAGEICDGPFMKGREPLFVVTRPRQGNAFRVSLHLNNRPFF